MAATQRLSRPAALYTALLWPAALQPNVHLDENSPLARSEIKEPAVLNYSANIINSVVVVLIIIITG